MKKRYTISEVYYVEFDADEVADLLEGLTDQDEIDKAIITAAVESDQMSYETDTLVKEVN